MREAPIPSREQEALTEIARTRVRPRVAWLLVLAFVLTIAVVPAAQATRDLVPRLVRFAYGVAAAVRGGLAGPPLAGNRALRAEMKTLEEGLEKESVVGTRLLPPAQWVLTRILGVGNEQAYLGRDGWLFYRPEIEHLTGAGFLEPAELERRRRSGEALAAPPQPDPVAAIADFARQLGARGIALLLVPVPVKAAIEPDRFSRRFAAGTAPPLANPSFAAFVRAVEALGVHVLDPAALLAEARRGAGEPQYLATDTHWTPAAMERVAERLAAIVADMGNLPPPANDRPPRPERAFAGRGDLAAMLELPAGFPPYAPERVVVHPADEFRPDAASPVLLLGDSFTNVYSVPEMGFGAKAGLAEQVSYFLGRPIDRIARNAGGAFATREELAGVMARGDDRLAAKKVVIWAFSARELTHGDWRLVRLPAVTVAPRASPATPSAAAATASAASGSRRPVTATVRSASGVPRDGQSPYRELIVAIRATGDDVEARTGRKDVLVYLRGMRDGHRTAAAHLRAGDRVRLTLRPWQDAAPEYESYQRLELPDDDALSLDAYWGEIVP